jgi:hypothetical protein
MKDGPEVTEIVSRLEVVELDRDEHGEPITSCVVEPIEGVFLPKDSKQKRLTATQQRALELLGEALSKDGHIPPACDHIPSNTRCVPEGLWREYCYSGQIAQSDKQEAKQKAFKRAASDLLVIGRVGIWNGLVWMIG